MTITDYQPTKINTRNKEYMNVHQWVIRHYGKANQCINGHKAKTYQWANVTNVYKRNIENFRQLCRSCHAKLDYSEYQRQYHRKRMTGNTYKRKAITQYKDGKKIQTYPTVTDAAELVGIVRTAITNVITGRSKRAAGYEWRIAN